MAGGFITDDDCLQMCRPIPAIDPEKYEMVQINSYPGHIDGRPFFQVTHGTIYIPGSDYSMDQIEDMLSTYDYPPFSEFSREQGEDTYRLLAEMFFETENQEYVSQEFRTWDDAVAYLSNLTGLDLKEYLNNDHKNDLLLVKEIDADQKEVNFVTTEAEYMNKQSIAALEDKEFIVPSKGVDVPSIYRFQKDGYTIEARFLDPNVSNASAVLSSFLSGSYNAPFTGVWQNDPSRTSSGAKQLLAELLNPIRNADLGRDKMLHPLKAIEWGKQHPDLVSNLDMIYAELGLFEIVRHRRSVTQGEASVMCCGKQVVRYGDDQYLQLENGKISNGFREKDGPLYGEIISGWGSALSDSSLRRSAILQFADKIAGILELPVPLQQKIEAAQSKTVTPQNKGKEDRSIEL